MFRTAEIQKNILILTGILSISYIIIFLLAPEDIANYTIADTEYWRETKNRQILKSAYEYNNKEDIQKFPETLGEWKSYDFRYPDEVYTKLNADILLSRAYTSGHGKLLWIDFINSKVGESFHNQRICVEGAGWVVDNESITEFTIEDQSKPFKRLYANRLDISKGDKKQVMVYWFMFKKFGSDNGVTMIRLSSPVIQNRTSTFDSMKSFVEGQLFGAMYERKEKDTITVGENMVRKYGKTGMIAIAMSILVPGSLIFIGIRKKN